MVRGVVGWERIQTSAAACGLHAVAWQLPACLRRAPRHCLCSLSNPCLILTPHHADILKQLSSGPSYVFANFQLDASGLLKVADLASRGVCRELD